MLRTVLCTHAAPTTPVDRRWASVDSSPTSSAAFPVSGMGQRPRHKYRGLLRLHSRCGLRACSTSFQGPLSQGFAVAVTRLPSLGFSAPDSYRGVSTELLGRDFHPLERCTFMAHPDILPLAKVFSGPPGVHSRPPLNDRGDLHPRDLGTICRTPSPYCFTIGLWFRIPVGHYSGSSRIQMGSWDVA